MWQCAGPFAAIWTVTDEECPPATLAWLASICVCKPQPSVNVWTYGSLILHVCCSSSKYKSQWNPVKVFKHTATRLSKERARVKKTFWHRIFLICGKWETEEKQFKLHRAALQWSEDRTDSNKQRNSHYSQNDQAAVIIPHCEIITYNSGHVSVHGWGHVHRSQWIPCAPDGLRQLSSSEPLPYKSTIICLCFFFWLEASERVQRIVDTNPSKTISRRGAFKQGT